MLPQTLVRKSNSARSVGYFKHVGSSFYSCLLEVHLKMTSKTCSTACGNIYIKYVLNKKHL